MHVSDLIKILLFCSITESLGENAFEVLLIQKDGERVYARPEVLDRNDGSYIVRYKLHRQANDLIIAIRYNQKPVAQSPYTLSGRSALQELSS